MSNTLDYGGWIETLKCAGDTDVQCGRLYDHWLIFAHAQAFAITIIEFK